jgi:hypothetical protein
MPWREEEDEERDFEWVDEDEQEVPAHRDGALRFVRPVGIIILLGLVILFLGSLLFRVATALFQLGGS